MPRVIEQFRHAFENAALAGFDAVEVHGAHGYLLDQFLRDSVNDRDDAYGGTLENRSRLLLEVVDQAIAAFGAGRVGVRIRSEARRVGKGCVRTCRSRWS